MAFLFKFFFIVRCLIFESFIYLPSNCIYAFFLKHNFINRRSNSFKQFDFSFLRGNFVKDMFYGLETIKTWNRNMSNFMRLDISRPSFYYNKYRIKNIFLKIINDKLVWEEVCKMEVAGYINFFSESFFSFNCFTNLNSLSLLCFNLYVSELDFYLFKISSSFCLKYHVFKDLFYSIPFGFRNPYFYNYNFNPLKLNKKFNIFIASCEYDQFPIKSFSFQKQFYFTRYLNTVFFALLGSNSFSYKLKIKVFSFLKSSLYLSVSKFSFSSSSESFLLFCGYNVFLVNFNFAELNNNISRKVFIKKKLFSRLSHFRLNFSKLVLSRAYFEFSVKIKTLLKSYSEFFVFSKMKNVWLNLFECEVIYKAQTTMPSFLPLLNLSGFDYVNYSFNLFIFKLKKYISQLKVMNTSLLAFSCLPLDICFDLLLREFTSGCSLLYFSLFDIVEIRNTYFRSFFISKNLYFSGLLFSDSDLLAFFDFFSSFQKSISFPLSSFRFFFPIGNFIEKLKVWGLFHLVKNRPVGNLKLITLDDLQIIYFYFSFSYKFLVWYKKAYNVSRLEVFLRILVYSCLLTISRKHKKSISWSYRIYKSDLNAFFDYSYLKFEALSFNGDIFLSI